MRPNLLVIGADKRHDWRSPEVRAWLSRELRKEVNHLRVHTGPAFFGWSP